MTRLKAQKVGGVIQVDTLTKLCGVPEEAWEYRLGTYTALEWVLERYKVCRVSVETVRVVREMPDQVIGK